MTKLLIAAFWFQWLILVIVVSNLLVIRTEIKLLQQAIKRIVDIIEYQLPSNATREEATKA